jgi:hypothetical protein
MCPTRIFKIEAKSEWDELFKDKGKWLFGIYFPKAMDRSEVKKLEKHKYPELFYLIDGEVNLVLKEDKEIKELPLKKDEVVIVDTWHNGYRPMGKNGICLVIERDKNPTRYMKI